MLFLLPVLFFWSLPATAAPELLDVRVGVNAQTTRFVLELSQKVPYRIFVLSNPARLVVDFQESKWRDVNSIVNKTTGVVTGYRHGLFKAGITRVVMDLSQPIKVLKNFSIPPGKKSHFRIVVDMEVQDAGQARTVQSFQSPGWKDYNARLTKQAGQKSPTAPIGKKKNKKKVVVIDPGHGGVDPGAIGVSGTYEKKVVLAAAKALKKSLEKVGRYRVILTRQRDVYIPLRQRYEIAHKNKADIFISLHADAAKSRKARGASVYTLSDKASDKEAEELAKKENRSDVIAGANLTGYTEEVTSILIDLAQQSVNESSWHFAEMLVKNMRKHIKLKKNAHRFAGFAVLKSPNVPSVLIELGYLSNRSDEKKLRSSKYMQKMATALTKAINFYFDRLEQLEKP